MINRSNVVKLARLVVWRLTIFWGDLRGRVMMLPAVIAHEDDIARHYPDLGTGKLITHQGQDRNTYAVIFPSQDDRFTYMQSRLPKVPQR